MNWKPFLDHAIKHQPGLNISLEDIQPGKCYVVNSTTGFKMPLEEYEKMEAEYKKQVAKRLAKLRAKKTQ